MVSIAAFQAVDPGSIPGHRTNFLFFSGRLHYEKSSNECFLALFFPQKTKFKGEME
jgi:hypothetical protein